MNEEKSPASDQAILKNAALLQLQKSNVIEQQLKQIQQRADATEQRVIGLQKELKKTRRSIRIFWLAELLGPVIAIALILGGAWYALKYAEQHYLDGESIIDKFLVKEDVASSS
jgi:hypothetical protein